MRPIALSIFLLLSQAIVASAQVAPATRILKNIDFEERRLGNPEDLPMHWDKVDGSNLPYYVKGRLTTDRAHGGQYSFRLDLDGGSVIYRYQPGFIKAEQGAHYLVQGYVQTTPLPNARARLTACFTDIDGHALAKTIQNSELYTAKADDDGWHRLSVELACNDPNAVWVVMEIGMVQPVIYSNSSLGERAMYPQDIHGTAWFDDITVSQVPHVEMTTSHPANIFARSDELRINALISDRYTDDLEARLVVRDSDGRDVYQHSGLTELAGTRRLTPGKVLLPLSLPELQAGYYRATLEISSRGQLLTDQTISLVRLADNAPPGWPDDRFGFIATDLHFNAWGQLPELLPVLGAGRIKLAVWNRLGDIEQIDSSAFDSILVDFQEHHITPTACLIDIPRGLAQKLSGSSDGSKVGNAWLWLLQPKPEQWEEPLNYLIARHANHLDRWQLGADGSDLFVTQPQMRKVYDTVYAQFAKLVTHPDLAMPWPAMYELEGRLPATVALSVPSSVLPSQLPLFLQEIRPHPGHHLSLSLQPLGDQPYGRQIQIRDLAQRFIYSLAGGAERIDIPLPVTECVDDENHVSIQPQETLVVSRTLIRTLSHCEYCGQVPIADGVEAFLFRRRDRNLDILAIWDNSGGTESKTLSVNLGPNPLRLDLWGNAAPLLHAIGDPGNQQVSLAIGPLPIFLVGVDGPMMQLRGSVHLDQPMIESSFTSHVRHIHFANSYTTPINGTLRITALPGWNITPSMFTFSLNPGEEFDREIQIEFPYNTFAGAKTIHAEFELKSDKTISFSVPVALKLGLTDVGMQTLAFRDGSDIVVQEIVQNYGEKPINYSTFAILPGQAREELLILDLLPGHSTIKRFRFPSAHYASGVNVRVGIKELDGSRILNAEVKLP